MNEARKAEIKSRIEINLLLHTTEELDAILQQEIARRDDIQKQLDEIDNIILSIQDIIKKRTG